MFPYFIVGILISLLILLALYFSFLKTSKENDEKSNSKRSKIEKLLQSLDKISIRLMEKEVKEFLMVSSISTITFYQGDIPSPLILNKLQDVLFSNPWLSSRLVQVHEKSPMCLLYSKDSDKISFTDHYEEVFIDKTAELSFDETSSMDCLLSHLHPHLVKKGKDCLNQLDEKLFKVLIVKVREFGRKEESEKAAVRIVRTAFVLSFSHLLGDGNNFYQIYSFFDSNAIVRSLSPVRNYEFPDKSAKKRGTDCQTIKSNFNFIFMLLTTLLFGKKPNYQLFAINPGRTRRIERSLSKRILW